RGPPQDCLGNPDQASSSHDGTRVLVDRLWPRGVKKSGAAVSQWMNEIAPSAELRRRFAHDPARWEEFRRRDEAHNQAVVLREALLH
ncbi:MAG: DUF488 domain-containing protein, partial [Solirubrobacteraceae bacterium]